MASPNEIIPILDLSNDNRVQVFRRTLHGLDEFEGMEVDAYIVITDRHVVVLDTLLCPEDVSDMLNFVRSDLNGRSLLCINSHADWDHAWGNCYFIGNHVAPIIAHEHCLTRLKSPEAQIELLDFQNRSSTFKNVFLQLPTITFKQTFTIHDSNFTIELQHAPGHHLDQIVAWMPELHVLLAFDAVEKPLPIIEGANCVPYMFNTLEHLISLHPQQVLCSHGNTTSPDQIHQNLAYLREIERRCVSLLQKRRLEEAELDHVSELIDYSYDAVVAKIHGSFDRTFYTWAHENNCQAIMHWLVSKP